MVYAVPQSKKSLKQNKFQFSLPDEPDRVYEIPLLKFIKPDIIFGPDSSGGDLQVAQRIFAEYLPEAFAKFDDTVQLEAFMNAWKDASGIDVGGIRGLAQLIQLHREAIQYELLERGRTLDDLGTRRLSWWDLKVILRHLPHGNALARERHGDGAYWTADTYLLAVIGDALQGANWQRAGDRNARRPKPLPRPGEQRAGKTFGRGRGIPVEEMQRRLGWE